MENQILKCTYCGHESEPNDGVHIWHNYTGGIGYFWQAECDNRVKCQDRVEQTKKLTKGMLPCQECAKC
jgi:hypothetical protein